MRPAVVRILLSLPVLLAAGCSAAPSDRSGQLFVEIDALLARDRPFLQARVLLDLSLIDDPRSVQLAQRFRDAANGELQQWAWYTLVAVDGPGRTAAIEQALQHEDYRVRTLGAIAAGRAGLDDPRLDAALERTLAHEEIGRLLECAAASLCQRDPRSGARRVFARLSARGTAWVGCGLAQYAAQPEPAFADAFRAALDGDLDQRILGARGLLALGRLPADDPLHATAARRTYREFGDYIMAIDRDHGAVGERTWQELVREAARAQVVVIGESHGSVAEGVVQCALIDGLVRRWGDAAGALLHERPMQEVQQLPATAARMSGMEVRLLEAESTEPKTVFERDDEASANLVQLARANPDRHFVVVYGNGHRESFVRHLRQNGIAVVPVSTSGTAEMLAQAWRQAGTLRIGGRVFRCDDGTWFVATDSSIEDLAASDPVGVQFPNPDTRPIDQRSVCRVAD